MDCATVVICKKYLLCDIARLICRPNEDTEWYAGSWFYCCEDWGIYYSTLLMKTFSVLDASHTVAATAGSSLENNEWVCVSWNGAHCVGINRTSRWNTFMHARKIWPHVVAAAIYKNMKLNRCHMINSLILHVRRHTNMTIHTSYGQSYFLCF